MNFYDENGIKGFIKHNSRVNSGVHTVLFRQHTGATLHDNIIIYFLFHFVDDSFPTEFSFVLNLSELLVHFEFTIELCLSFNHLFRSSFLGILHHIHTDSQWNLSRCSCRCFRMG